MHVARDAFVNLTQLERLSLVSAITYMILHYSTNDKILLVSFYHSNFIVVKGEILLSANNLCNFID